MTWGERARYSGRGVQSGEREVGRYLENGERSEGTAQFDFNRLYQKSKWLKQLEVPSNKDDQEKWRDRITRYKDTIVKKNGQKVVKRRKTIDTSAVPYVSTGQKLFGTLATSLTQASFYISNVPHTLLPAVTHSTSPVAQNLNIMSQGFVFILGHEPQTPGLVRAA